MTDRTNEGNAMSEVNEMTPEEIARLKGLCEKATPEIWRITWVSDCVRIVIDRGRGKTIIAKLNPPQLPEKETWANAEFIAASRSAVPALLAALEAAEARVRVLEEWRGKAFDILTLAKYEINDGGDHDLAVEIGNFTAEALVDIDAAILREVKS